MMLPLPSRPFRQQSGLGQQRDRLLLRFIHVLMTEKPEEIQTGSRVAGPLGDGQQHFPDEAPTSLTFQSQNRCWLRVL